MPQTPVTARFSDDELAYVDRARNGRSRAQWLRTVALEAAVPDQPSPVTVPGCDHPRGRVIKNFCYRCGRMVNT